MRIEPCKASVVSSADHFDIWDLAFPQPAQTEDDTINDLSIRQLEELRALVLEKIGSGNMRVTHHFWEALVIQLHAAIEEKSTSRCEWIH